MRRSAVLLVVAVGVLVAACGRTRADAPPARASSPAVPERVALAADAPTATMIRTEAVQRVPLPLSEVLPARIAYDEDRTSRVTVGFAGRISKLIAVPGDAVRVGSPLAEIDSPDFGLAASDLAKARADEERKRLALARSRDLLAGGVVPGKDVESADADFAQARAETSRAAQRLRNLDPSGSTARGGRLLLASPVVGIVTERNANPAMEVNPTLVQPLFVISDLHRLWVLIDVPERWIGQVRPGMKVSIETDAYPGRRFAATIAHVAQVLDPGTRRIAVRATVDNPRFELRPEMFVRTTVLRDEGVGVRVPNEALVTAGLHTYVFQEAKDHAFRRVAVDLLVKGADYSYVDGPVDDREPLVTSGALLLAAEQADGAHR